MYKEPAAHATDLSGGNHQIEEGGWQKPVAPPSGKQPPAGLPKASLKPPVDAQSGAKDSDG
jgi:hypothetical protein